MTHTYTILGATGNTGKRIAAGLLDAGHSVRVVGRDEGRLAELVKSGAEAFVGDLSDHDLLVRAFTGADAAWTLIPPSYASADYGAYQDELSQTLADAQRNAGLKRAIFLSSVGAHLPMGNGPIAGLFVHEKRLAIAHGMDWISLRAPYFMENLNNYLMLAKLQGIIGSPIDPDVKIPMMATADIADEALRRFLALDFEGGNVVELGGPADLSLNEVAAAFSEAAGRTIPYVRFSYEDTRNAMLGMGLSASVVDLFIEMYKGFDDGVITFEHPDKVVRSGEVTIEVFAKQFAAALSA